MSTRLQVLSTKVAPAERLQLDALAHLECVSVSALVRRLLASAVLARLDALLIAAKPDAR